MCNHVLVTAFALLILTLSFSALSAETPFIAVYFDAGLSQEAKDCPGFGVMDTLYVALVNANCFVGGAQLRILYPPSMIFLADVNPPGFICVGPFCTTATGRFIIFDLPQNGFSPVLLIRVVILWNCNDCSFPNDPILVTPHPETGELSYFCSTPLDAFPAVGLTAAVCSTVPVEETSWGRIKALYR